MKENEVSRGHIVSLRILYILDSAIAHLTHAHLFISEHFKQDGGFSDGSFRSVFISEIQDFRIVSSDDRNKTISRVSKQKQCAENMRRTDLTSTLKFVVL